jgi:hypothetical protein
VKKTILISILFLISITLLGCEQVVENITYVDGNPTIDGVDIIPSKIEFQDCVERIKEANPEMKTSDVRDNCVVLLAIINEDVELYNEEVSDDFKEKFEKQFE